MPRRGVWALWNWRDRTVAPVGVTIACGGDCRSGGLFGIVPGVGGVAAELGVDAVGFGELVFEDDDPAGRF